MTLLSQNLSAFDAAFFAVYVAAMVLLAVAALAHAARLGGPNNSGGATGPDSDSGNRERGEPASGTG